MKESSKNQSWLIYIAILLILAIIIYDLLSSETSLSVVILGITAIIILWYTWETHRIRIAEAVIAKTSNEAFKRATQPIVGCRLFPNELNPLDIGFELINKSEYPVATRVKFKCKLGDDIIRNIWPAYDGKEYYNLQYRQLKYGHFNWLDLYNKAELINDEELRNLKKSSLETIKNKISEELTSSDKFKHNARLTIDVEVYCENEMGQTTYYPPEQYHLNLSRLAIISQLTSTKPYWEFDSHPPWVK